MAIAYYLVDAFTERPFAGNPAAVCLLPQWPDDGWLQDVGREMNQAETAFLVRSGSGFGSRRKSRWHYAGTPRWPRPTLFGRAG